MFTEELQYAMKGNHPEKKNINVKEIIKKKSFKKANKWTKQTKQWLTHIFQS